MAIYSYACADCEGMESCPAKFVAETKEEVMKLTELHAEIAHGEDANQWDQETRGYIQTLIKPV
jgi:predicted small metal-binding protein